jgi:hypothetical protein
MCSGPMRIPRAVSNSTRSPLSTSVATIAVRGAAGLFSRSKSTSSGRRRPSGARSCSPGPAAVSAPPASFGR